MSTVDILKKSFFEGYASSGLSVKSIVVCMVITVLIAAYIFILYRVINRSSFYNKNFNIALPALAIITAAIILTIQSSIVISLGMVGALSSVRFKARWIWFFCSGLSASASYAARVFPLLL